MTFVSNRAANMSSGLLLDPIPTPDSEPSSGGPRFRPYSTPNQHVTKGRYITSNDPRGYIPVYEYPLNGQWIMLDMDDGYVLWTGIWKALGNSKADIVKMIESQPDLAPQLRRVRGGYLKIQGTWMPYEIALRLARRVAWPIRHELIPLFGPTFPSTCLSPDQPGYGQVVKPGSGRRRARRTYPTNNQPERPHDMAALSSAHPQPPRSVYSREPAASLARQNDRPVVPYQDRHDNDSQYGGSPIQLYLPYTTQTAPYTSNGVGTSTPCLSKLSGTSQQSTSVRHSPYSTSPTSHPSTMTASRRERGSLNGFSDTESFRLPPLYNAEDKRYMRRNSLVALPPISAMDERRQGPADDSATVLRRLQSTDEPEEYSPGFKPRTVEGLGYLPSKLDTTSLGTPCLSSANTRLPPIHFPFASRAASSPSPYSTPTSSTQPSSSVDSPSSPDVTTPLSARPAHDDAKVVYQPSSPATYVTTAADRHTGQPPSSEYATYYRGYNDQSAFPMMAMDTYHEPKQEYNSTFYKQSWRAA